MKKLYTVQVPLCAFEQVEVIAENEEDAISLAYEEVANDMTLNYDPLSESDCWVDYIQDIDGEEE